MCVTSDLRRMKTTGVWVGDEKIVFLNDAFDQANSCLILGQMCILLLLGKPLMRDLAKTSPLAILVIYYSFAPDRKPPLRSI